MDDEQSRIMQRGDLSDDNKSEALRRLQAEKGVGFSPIVGPGSEDVKSDLRSRGHYVPD